jgi:hypothetical protein
MFLAVAGRMNDSINCFWKEHQLFLAEAGRMNDPISWVEHVFVCVFMSWKIA